MQQNTHSFDNPFLRRKLYKRAHSDAKLAAWVRSHDPRYLQRAKLNRSETVINDVIVAVCLPLGSSLEFIINNLLELVEGKNPQKRSVVGHAYDIIMLQIFDPFHRKRALYTLTESK